MNILLHICCGPCLIYPLKSLNSQGFKAKGFFYNPNIHPVSEYNRRKEAVAFLSNGLQLEVEYPEYMPLDFIQAIGTDLSAPQRCLHCWKMRLSRTALYAQANGFDAFTSTLLVSPYQDQESLKELGNQVAEEAKVGFYYEDFREGFRAAHDEARSKGIYCQKYCGCSFSEAERKVKVKK